jgi:hypothetical protein
VTAQDPKDVARLRQAFTALALDGRGDPVDAGRIFDALHGDSNPEDRHAVVEELLVNPAAAEAWRLARELAPEAAIERTMPGGMWTWMSIAAAAMVAVGLAWPSVSGRPAEEPAYRSLETRALASALPSTATLPRAQPVLRWTGVEGARYRVRVLTKDLEVLEESAESPAREFTVSPESLRQVAPGDPLLWQVEARVPGEALVVSPTFNIQVP